MGGYSQDERSGGIRKPHRGPAASIAMVGYSKDERDGGAEGRRCFDPPWQSHREPAASISMADYSKDERDGGSEGRSIQPAPRARLSSELDVHLS